LDPANANHRIDPSNQLGHKAVPGLTRRGGAAGAGLDTAAPRQDTGGVDASTMVAQHGTRRQPVGRPGAPGSLADRPNLRRVVIGAILVGTLLLGSMGGAILAAPVLLPLLWWTARTTTRGVRLIGVILAALVVAEVVWAGVYLVVGERQPYVWALPALSAAVTVWLMLVTTRPDPPGSGSLAHPAR
jgi:hypothetical protein